MKNSIHLPKKHFKKSKNTENFNLFTQINNLNFDLDLSRFIGTYWPLLLILAGVAKLGENLTGYSKTHPASKICNPRGTV